jgi:hypothetical protein
LPVIVVVTPAAHCTSHISPGGHAIPPSPLVVLPLELLLGGRAASPKLPLVELPVLLPVELLPPLLPLLLLPPLELPLALLLKPLAFCLPPHAGIEAAPKSKVEPTSAATRNE